uniref:Large ribosomal subunit protein mL54 n=1 Tax=Araucaria cunninghamii TaxID=56994 RepID=A0A0D6R8H9_ARACU
MQTNIRKIASALPKPAIRINFREFAAKAKKGGGKGSAAAPSAPAISEELKATTVVGANINKDGADPSVKADSEYPDWLWHLLDKQIPLSELQRKDTNTMSVQELQRFVKLDNRRRIKENNALKAKK